MSMLYGMDLELKGFDKSKLRKIRNAAKEEWPFEEMEVGSDGVARAYAEGNLGGGETDEQFARRLAKAIFEANGKPCKFEVRATYLEDLPCETHTFDEKKLP